MKRLLFLSLLITAMTGCLSAADYTASSSLQPKHEFRGAWMHIIGQKQYAQMNPEQTRQ